MKKAAKGLVWILLPLVITLGLIVRAMPAQWGLWLANLPLQMEGVTGTIWQGRVANVVLPYPGGYYSFGQLEWELDPWSLLVFSPCAQFSTEMPGQSSSGTACAGIGASLRLSETRFTVPASVAEVWAPVRLRGQVDAQIQELVFADNRIAELEGSGSWSNAHYHNSQTWVELGTLAFDLSEAASGGIAANVFDIEGPLELDLESQFTLAGAYDIRGNIVLRPGAPQEIAQLLAIVAQETGRGEFRVEWVGS